MNNKLKLMIFCSLLLNVLFIGAAVGFFYNHDTPPPEERILSILNNAHIAPERRIGLKNKVSQMQRGNNTRWEEIKKVREESLQILTAETFDATAYREKLSELFNSRDKHHKRMTNLIVEIASELSQKDRMALAEALRRPPPPRRPKMKRLTD